VRGLAWLTTLDADHIAGLVERLRPHFADLEPSEHAPLMSCSQAARQAGVHVETIRRATRSGALKCAGRVGAHRIAGHNRERGTASAAANTGPEP